MPTVEVIIADENLLDAKEALAMAYLGFLRWRHQPNALASATGASLDSIGGAVYLPA